MSQAALTLLAALVGAAVAIASPAVAPIVQSRRAHHQWLRDKRADAFERFFSSLQAAEGHVAQMDVDMQEVGLAAVNVPAQADALGERLLREAGRLELYATPLVSRLAIKTAGAYFSYISELQERANSQRAEREIQTFVDGLVEVRDAIRRELGICS